MLWKPPSFWGQPSSPRIWLRLVQMHLDLVDLVDPLDPLDLVDPLDQQNPHRLGRHIDR